MAAKKPRKKAPAGPKPKRPRESKAAFKERVGRILALLDERYPDVECELDHKNAFELLVATILSAQCTDKRVNMVTPDLFARFPSPEAMAEGDLAEIEELVRTTGFFRNKAKNIQGAATLITDKHNGEVPRDFEDLLELPGVARKTANVVMGVAFEEASGVVVDTHVKRITNLLNLTKQSDPVKIEADLKDALPQEHWIRFSHQLIHHGRGVCIARRPECGDCPLREECPSALPPAV